MTPEARAGGQRLDPFSDLREEAGDVFVRKPRRLKLDPPIELVWRSVANPLPLDHDASRRRCVGHDGNDGTRSLPDGVESEQR